jgi:hypothetical protein
MSLTLHPNFKAQELLKVFIYNGLAIWKAVAIGACLGDFGGVDTCGGRNFAAVAGYRPGRRGLRGSVKFHSGEISPRQFVISRFSRDGFPNRREFTPKLTCQRAFGHTYRAT